MVTETINIVVTTRGARVAQAGIRGIGRSSRVATVAVRALGAALATIGVGLGVRELLRLSDAATQVGNRIRTVTSSTEVFISVQDRLFDVASRTGQSIESTSRLFQRLSVGTRDLGVGTARVISVVEGLNAALLVSGSTAREAEAALLQLGQGLASDNLSGEELRSLRENLPQLAQELADVLGEPIGALKELGRQGRLNAETVFPALEIAVERFQEKLENGEVIFTFAQAFNAVRNAIIKAFSIIQRSTGLTQDLTKSIFDLSDGLAERLVVALASAIDFIADVIDRFNAFRVSIGGFAPIFSALSEAFSFLGKSGVVAVQALNTAFVTFLQGLAESNRLLQRFLRFLGLASDTDVQLADAQAAATAEDAEASFESLLDTIENFSDRSFLELATGIDVADVKATKLANTARALADGLRAAAAEEVPVVDDPPRDPPDFFERAAARRTDIEEERGREDILVPRDLSERISTSFRDGIASAIQDGDDLFGALRNNLETAANEALVESFQSSFDFAESLLSEAFQSAADALGPALKTVFGESAGELGNALSGALQFAALQGLSALLGGGGNTSGSSAGNVQSAITSTQAVRGIVAGPQEIAIANVGANIADAVEPLLEETRTQTGVLRAILANSISGTTGSGTDSDLAALANGGAPLAAA